MLAVSFVWIFINILPLKKVFFTNWRTVNNRKFESFLANLKEYFRRRNRMLNPVTVFQRWIKITGKEKLQAFQDAFARAFEIGLCIWSVKGKPLTIWSNSSLYCHFIRENYETRCVQEHDNAVNYILKTRRPKLFTCYTGVSYFLCPICFQNEVVCLVYGSGFTISKNKLLRNNIPVMTERKVRDIIELITGVFDIINFDKSDLPGDGFENNKVFIRDELKCLQDKLSSRELEVAWGILTGLSNKAIADQLYISEKTVKTHISNILCKMNLKDRTQLIIYCRENYRS